MNNIDDMWPICHDCPYWEVCEPPYICPDLIKKQNKTSNETDQKAALSAKLESIQMQNNGDLLSSRFKYQGES